MKQLGWALAGVVLGFVLGGVAPRRELAAAEAELSRQRDEVVKLKRRGGGAGVVGLEGLFGGGRDERAAHDGTDPDGAEPDGEIPDEGPAEGGGGAAEAGGAGPAAAAAAPATLLEEFDAAVAVQAARRAQSRAALVEQAGLSPAETAELDAIVDGMNARVAEHADELVGILLSGEEPGAADLFGLTHEVSGILLEAQVGIERLVGDERLGGLDPEAAFAPNLIDLELLREGIAELDEAGLAP
jgi:hypothetical protein